MEKMTEFFTNRVDIYDEHMLHDVPGCRTAYQKMAQLLRPDVATLLDLGCGTGLELDAIFRLYPDIQVTGIDLTQAMLDRLRQKHPDKEMTLVCADYFVTELGKKQYDAAVSFQTMHHFVHEQKRGLYTKLCAALKPGGMYIECDYMVETQEEEDLYFAENRRIRDEMRIAPDEFYHYDTPCTVENQMQLLYDAGFVSVKLMFREENTTILVAKK